jgi:hypothetical protein
MKTRSLAVIAFGAAAASQAGAATPATPSFDRARFQIAHEKFVLDNGLTLLGSGFEAKRPCAHAQRARDNKGIRIAHLFLRRRSNALIQLQARYHHSGIAASKKCLSAATFVRLRRRSPLRPFRPPPPKPGNEKHQSIPLSCTQRYRMPKILTTSDVSTTTCGATAW